MISCVELEQPGKWHLILSGVILALAFCPNLPLFWLLVSGTSSFVWENLGPGFASALSHSLVVCAASSAASVLIGLPAGALAGLYEFPGRRMFLWIIAIPLLVPSFLWAIGLSQLGVGLSGITGGTYAFTSLGLPLVLYVTFVSARRLTKSQTEGVRIVGGEWLVLRQAVRAVFPAAFLVGCLSGLLSLSDPGPGQILGFSDVASEILVSFSALYDFELAARQCLVLSAIVAFIALPLAILIVPGIAPRLLGKDIEPTPLTNNRTVRWLGPVFFGAIVTLTMGLPILGIILPMFSRFSWELAMSEITRTIGDTVFYAILAGLFATVLGWLLAIAVGRGRRLAQTAVIGLFLLLSLPPELGALGVIRWGTAAPAALDFFLRDRTVVGIISALRFLPIAAIIMIRGVGTTSPTSALAAAVHGIPITRYMWRVAGPQMIPFVTISTAIVALLSTASVSIALLLRPPGADTLPIAIFTVMANAPESLVATLCFFYIAGAALLLAAGCQLTRWSRFQ
ncbi:MAG: hypothetical protein HY537_11175 [Deltaproteobacteria bacterium]|nr:hypothetical protein [Deltaproteobacteria bacterium]